MGMASLCIFQLIHQRWVSDEAVHRHGPKTNGNDPYHLFHRRLVEHVNWRHDRIYERLRIGFQAAQTFFHNGQETRVAIGCPM